MPSAASRSAMARPMPLAAPVTTATRPLNWRIATLYPHPGADPMRSSTYHGVQVRRRLAELGHDVAGPL